MKDVIALRRDIGRLKYRTAELKLELVLRRLKRAVGVKYNSDQPRVAAGNPDGGQWTAIGNASFRQFDKNPARSTGSDFSSARRISPAIEVQCERQRIKDEFHCRMIGLRAC